MENRKVYKYQMILISYTKGPETMKDYEIKPKDNFLASMKRKNSINAKKADEGLKPKKFSMDDLQYTNMPTKISVVGPLSKPSAKKALPGENQLQGGMPKEFQVT